MNKKGFVNKYARALYNVSVQQEDVKEVSERIHYISAVMKTVPEFSQFLQTHQVSAKDKLKAVRNVLKNDISSLEVDLLAELIQHGHVLLMAEISRRFTYLVEVDSSVVNVKISSAAELTEDEIKNIVNKIEAQSNKKVSIETEIDANLIGGIKLRVGNTVIDNSISRRLELLKDTLTQA